MKTTAALSILTKWDKQGLYVFSKKDLAKLFDEQGDKLSETLKRLQKQGVLLRVARGVYMYSHSSHKDSHTIEEIALKLRQGHYSYMSLESILSEYGRISQIPVGRITVMTTGRSGEFFTPFGVIEFTHTDLDLPTLLENTIQIEGSPLPIAQEDFALRNLRRVGRNVNMLVDEDD
jgi:hypothetical protein